MTSTAYSLIRDRPCYRRAAFARGLAACGYQVVDGRWPPMAGGLRGQVAVIWSRYGTNHEQAKRFEQAGGRVIVAENGYLGRGGSSPKFDVHPKGPEPHHYYAMALGGHNGQGRWGVGGPERLEDLAIRPARLRAAGGYALVCPNRSFGVPGRIMPTDWAERTAQGLRSQGREARIRKHPGNDAPAVPLADDLAGADEVHVWSSNAGIHALVAGIPVVSHAPFWVCKVASQARIEIASETDWNERRTEALIMMSWAQWRLEEIEAGAPFRHLLGEAG